jgi:hypothetical protein
LASLPKVIRKPDITTSFKNLGLPKSWHLFQKASGISPTLNIKYLSISFCPDLMKHGEKQTGEDWCTRIG